MRSVLKTTQAGRTLWRVGGHPLSVPPVLFSGSLQRGEKRDPVPRPPTHPHWDAVALFGGINVEVFQPRRTPNKVRVGPAHACCV